MSRLHVDVCDAAALLRQRLVLVQWLGELGDDIPGVEEAGEEAETAEKNVDDGVGAANPAFDPYGQRGEEDGQNTEEDVCGAHGARGCDKNAMSQNRGLI